MRRSFSRPSPRNGAVTSALGLSATSAPARLLLCLRLAVREVGTVLGVRGEPGGGAAHALLVLLVDEPVDRPLEPLPRGLREVVALLELEASAIGPERLQVHLA